MSGAVSRPPLLVGIGLLALLPAGWWLGGPGGALLGGGLALAGLIISPLSLFALAHVAWLLLPAPTVVDVLVFELPLAVILFGAPAYRSTRVPVPIIAAAVFMPLAGLAIVLAASRSLLTASAVLLGSLALGGYTIHRYELLQLGLLDESAASASSPPIAEETETEP